MSVPPSPVPYTEDLKPGTKRESVKVNGNWTRGRPSQVDHTNSPPRKKKEGREETGTERENVQEPSTASGGRSPTTGYCSDPPVPAG